MDIIELVTVEEHNRRTGRMETIVSHGINMRTGKTVILPCETPQNLGARKDPDLGWILQDTHGA